MVLQPALLISLLLLINFPYYVWGSKLITRCGQKGNSDTICSPLNGDTWKQNGTYYLTTWNPLYPTYVSSASLSLYLYLIENFQKVNLVTFHNINNTGEYPLLINDSWFDPALHLHGTTHDAMLYLVSSDVDPLKEMNNLNSAWPQPIQLSIVRASSSRQESDPPSSAGEKPSWVTPVIVVGCILLVITLCLISFCLYRNIKRRKLIFEDKSQLDMGSKNSPVYPITCSPYHPLFTPTGHLPPTVSSSYPNLSSLPPQLLSSRPTTIQSMSNLSTPPLSSTDALLIADTFRQKMRRPEWPLHGPAQSSSTLSQSSSSSTIHDGTEERIRRLASEQLLKLELEAEGTVLKQMGGSD